MPIENEIRSLTPDALVTLYVIDTAPIGGNTIYRFTKGTDGVAPVQFDGHTYNPIDMEATGFKWDGQGSFPKPKFKLVNTGGIVIGALLEFGDLVGASFVRIRTFAKHLDNGSDPDPTAIFPLEIYTVNQRTHMNKIFVEWQLTSALDLMAVKLPRRQCIRDTCTHLYRRWDADAGSFDYTAATCPYVGNKKFDENGKAVNLGKNDVCGRKLSDCKARFGENAVLPTRAFPGIGNGT